MRKGYQGNKHYSGNRPHRGEGNQDHKRTQHEQPKEYRRLDSIARLICGEEKCAAVSLYEGKLLVASNKGTNTHLVQNYMKFFQYIVKNNLSYNDAWKSKDMVKWRKKLRSESIYEKYKDHESPIISEIILLRTDLKETKGKLLSIMSKLDEMKKELLKVDQKYNSYIQDYSSYNEYKKAYDSRQDFKQAVTMSRSTDAQILRDKIKEIKDKEREIFKLLDIDITPKKLKKALEKYSCQNTNALIIKKIENIKKGIADNELEFQRLQNKEIKLEKDIENKFRKLSEKMFSDISKVIEFLTNGNTYNIPLRQALMEDYIDINKEQEYKPSMSNGIPDISIGIHAEMRILEYIDSSRRSLFKQNPAIYIGISKLCCRDCANIVQQINKKSKGINTEVDDQSIKQVVETRGFHNNQYPWPTPPFVEKYHFKLLNKAETKIGKAKEMHSDSESSAMKTEESNLEYLEPLFPERRLNHHSNVEVYENIIRAPFVSRVENNFTQARDYSTQTNRGSKNHTNGNQYASNQEKKPLAR
ncbi:hypothetical protein NF27_JR00050 [Candidatus Jidaibacter acanthamoeba]|uniref:Uncharacterized protein n=1 Tax=Candidatus Jidaibacter acanthamoebae TaxID=86105 RepID=A0A0C1MQ47_9RICK|nr:nucleic acid/nucleotide deaminase domain-containing protein [Candidatus Jidaibacter acanthamoeba]KIE04082.1 hypothetical protein NF27_JR00050 [Candidatus Jidaibacter acanthamoeba]